VKIAVFPTPAGNFPANIGDTVLGGASVPASRVTRPADIASRATTVVSIPMTVECSVLSIVTFLHDGFFARLLLEDAAIRRNVPSHLCFGNFLPIRHAASLRRKFISVNPRSGVSLLRQTSARQERGSRFEILPGPSASGLMRAALNFNHVRQT
jgi:hypothetical protein